jgi:hypothetical protein
MQDGMKDKPNKFSLGLNPLFEKTIGWGAICISQNPLEECYVCGIEIFTKHLLSFAMNKSQQRYIEIGTYCWSGEKDL